jgi:peptidoglycan biosynthesis protein MviN/MurJ (putative lipid II flippase)
MLRTLPPRSVDQGIDQIQTIVETNFARRLGSGFVSYYNNALTLQSAPILLFGNAIATAVFPKLNLRITQGRPDLFRSDFLKTLRIMVWLITPVVIVSFFGRGYLARLIFSRNAPEIAIIFGFLSVAIFFRVMYTVISRWFYAQKDTKTPLFVSLFVITLDIVLVSVLARPSTYGVAGLGIAQAVAGMTEVIILVTIMLLRDHQLFDREFLGAMLKILSVAGFSILAGYLTVTFIPLGGQERGLLELGSRLGLISASVFTVYVVISALFGLDEAKIFFNRLKRLILKPIRVQY